MAAASHAGPPVRMAFGSSGQAKKPSAEAANSQSSPFGKPYSRNYAAVAGKPSLVRSHTEDGTTRMGVELVTVSSIVNVHLIEVELP